jgi:hypothetical protein
LPVSEKATASVKADVREIKDHLSERHHHGGSPPAGSSPSSSGGPPRPVSRSTTKTYGSLAAVIIFLVWVWISSIAILLGAEFNVEPERRRAITSGHPETKEPLRRTTRHPRPR